MTYLMTHRQIRRLNDRNVITIKTQVRKLKATNRGLNCVMRVCLLGYLLSKSPIGSTDGVSTLQSTTP